VTINKLAARDEFRTRSLRGVGAEVDEEFLVTVPGNANSDSMCRARAVRALLMFGCGSSDLDVK